jgi:hypothetical protein
MNALSFGTWIIHISSLLEWMVAMILVWRYATVTNEPAWKGFAFAMIPALMGGTAVVVWHYFDNDLALSWMGHFQGAMTLLGNVTLMMAAYGLYRGRTQNQ